MYESWLINFYYGLEIFILVKCRNNMSWAVIFVLLHLLAEKYWPFFEELRYQLIVEKTYISQYN